MEVKSLYIHIPFCISKCKYCDFFSIPCRKIDYDFIPDSYISALCSEIIFRIEKYNVKSFETIYIGGGTPSLLTYMQLEKIFSTIREKTLISSTCEITIEANPDDITEELIENFKKVGITRISLGIQSFSDKALSYVSRRATAKINKNALNIIKKFWHRELSVDLICGLPKENKQNFEYDINYLLKIKPDHISMYSLTIEEETPLGREFSSGKLDYDFDFADDLWLNGKELLKENGYIHYEVSNFSLPGKQCRHNLKYWNHENYIGCGSGGAGSVYNDLGSGIRWTNVQNIEKYCDFWNEQISIKYHSTGFYQEQRENSSAREITPPEIIENISLETSIFEFFMMGMRKLQGVTEKQFEEIFHTSIPEKIKNTLIQWGERGLCLLSKEKNDVRYSLGHKGILYLNKFLEEII